MLNAQQTTRRRAIKLKSNLAGFHYTRTEISLHLIIIIAIYIKRKQQTPGSERERESEQLRWRRANWANVQIHQKETLSVAS